MFLTVSGLWAPVHQIHLSQGWWHYKKSHCSPEIVIFRDTLQGTQNLSCWQTGYQALLSPQSGLGLPLCPYQSC